MFFGFTDPLYCMVVIFSVTFIDLFSCIAASLFNKLTYLLTRVWGMGMEDFGGSVRGATTCTRSRCCRCKNGRTDRDYVWRTVMRGPREPVY